MSTNRIEEAAEEARKALGELAAAARKRDHEIKHAREALNRERNNVVIGARAAMRDIDDHDEVLEEEAEQFEHIVRGRVITRRTSILEPEPDGEPSSSTVPLTGAAPSVPVDSPVRETAVPPAEPVAAVMTDRVPLVQVQRSPYDPRSWCLWCQLVAVLGGLIGLFVGLKTRWAVTDEVHHWKWVPGTIWVLAIAGVGFFVFGLVCAIVCEQLNRQRAAQT